MENKEISKTWFLLLGGCSPDGCGKGKYIGRTTDIETARKHYEKCRANPYSIGDVIIVTDQEYTLADSLTDWDSI